MSKAAIIFIVSIVFLGALIAYPILKKNQAKTRAEHSTEDLKEAAKGPHGGMLLSQEEFQLEITIFERGVPPEYRVYAYQDGKPLDPSQVTLQIQLNRLGGRMDTFHFNKQQDYLRGNAVVEEPHSFDVKVTANYKGKNHDWEYPSYEGRTVMTAEGIKTAGIVVETAGPAKMKKILELPGEVILNPDRQTHVLPRFDGIVTAVHANLGDQVRKGQALATMDSTELAQEKSEYVEAMHEQEFAKKAYEREQILWDKKITSEQDYLSKKYEYEQAKLHYEAETQKLKAAGISLETVETGSRLAAHTIRAPIDGIVIEKNIANGQAVQAEDKLFVVADLSVLYAEVTIPAKDITAVREGQNVTVISEVVDSQVQGHLTYIGPLLGEQTRASKGRISIPNPNGSWKPGLFVKVYVTEEEVTVPVAVKASALQTFRDWDVVFLAVGNTFEVRPLEIGRQDGEWVEILSGISPGDHYVAENSFVVKADIEKSGATHDH